MLPAPSMPTLIAPLSGTGRFPRSTQVDRDAPFLTLRKVDRHAGGLSSLLQHLGALLLHNQLFVLFRQLSLFFATYRDYEEPGLVFDHVAEKEVVAAERDVRDFLGQGLAWHPANVAGLVLRRVLGV